VNRPTSVKTDNFFLMIYRALSQRRVPLALRIACTNIFLVALALSGNSHPYPWDAC